MVNATFAQNLSTLSQAQNHSSAFNSHLNTAMDVNGTYARRESREYDTAAWAFHTESKVIAPNLAFLPILGLVLLVICSSLRAFKWSRDHSRMKARGDVEIWDEDDVNYGILQEGDKNYLHVEIRGDGSSLYDTITSFGVIGNGNIPSPTCAHHPYQDSVTSYKSLLMQRPEGNQYDSVKSYKAFLQRVTQDQDLAVEVKLLENYPIKSKSAEHFVVVEEESSEKQESLTSKVLSALPLRKQLNMIEKLVHPDKKKTRGRCASGDVMTGHRKRSASNPTSRRIARKAAAASSLPSIQCHSSSDSDEDALKSLREDRRRMWAERKKMYRSVSGSKIARNSVTGESTAAVGGASACSGSGGSKRRRHYSADSARRLKKPCVSYSRHITGVSEDGILENGLKRMTKAHGSIKKKKSKSDDKHQNDSETSENPTSSHSSCENSDVRSDAIESFSNEEDDDTKLCTHLSNMSDDQTIDDNVFLSVDTETTLSSSEVLNTPPTRALSSSRKLLARAKEDFFTKEAQPTFIDVAQISSEKAREQAGCSSDMAGEQNVIKRYKGQDDTPVVLSAKILQKQEANRTKARNSLQEGAQHHKSLLRTLTDPSLGLSSKDTSMAQSCSKTQGCASSGNVNSSGADSAGLSSGETAQGQSPRKVQRFHVTFISSDISSLNSE